MVILEHHVERLLTVNRGSQAVRSTQSQPSQRLTQQEMALSFWGWAIRNPSRAFSRQNVGLG